MFFTVMGSNPSRGGKYNSRGNIMMPPPIPNNPEKNPPNEPAKRRNT
jgi:hypothetical protein